MQPMVPKARNGPSSIQRICKLDFGINAVHQPFGLIDPVITLHVPLPVAVFPAMKSEHPEHF